MRSCDICEWDREYKNGSDLISHICRDCCTSVNRYERLIHWTPFGCLRITEEEAHRNVLWRLWRRVRS